MEDIVKAICQKEGFTCRDIQALSGGQVNHVYRVGDYVVRIGAREDAGLRLRRESELLQSLAGQMPIAEILAFGEHQGTFYQVQRYVPGKKLYEIWKDLTPGEQESIADVLAASLKTLHSRVYPDFGSGQSGSRQYTDWPGFLSEKFRQTLEEIQTLNIQMVPGFVDMAVNYFEEHKSVLQSGVPTLVHGDLSLVNILALGGRVTALIDFEYAVQAPADYELWVLEAFCLYPNDWAEEENETFCTADFASIFPLLRKHYPSIFETPHLRERVNLYHLDAALSNYLAWRKDNLSTIPPERMAAKEFYMARIANFIFGHGVRMFF